ARRVEAKPGVKEYGALSVTLGLYFRPRVLFSVDPRCFYPRPEVMSALVSLEPATDLPLEGKERELFHRVVKSAFWGRRKTLLTALAEAPHLNIKRDSAASALSAMGLDAKIRGENLGVREFVDLTQRLSREDHEQYKP
ncbi:MAG TPA: 16S rRNA (adenine(1518)-N(6)/adenine(1519)-N(6))-dimethyltransferase, partial [Spirochaetes bacterium]|nr:16S rRNA (adenine(1518)-N(6)/adenine(1519)-N(6))-dimethyltransferase [Spirochaetota bacterium]